jgi:hypothetical protein
MRRLHLVLGLALKFLHVSDQIGDLAVFQGQLFGQLRDLLVFSGAVFAHDANLVVKPLHLVLVLA